MGWGSVNLSGRGDATVVFSLIGVCKADLLGHSGCGDATVVFNLIGVCKADLLGRSGRGDAAVEFSLIGGVGKAVSLGQTTGSSSSLLVLNRGFGLIYKNIHV